MDSIAVVVGGLASVKGPESHMRITSRPLESTIIGFGCCYHLDILIGGVPGKEVTAVLCEVTNSHFCEGDDQENNMDRTRRPTMLPFLVPHR